MEKEGEGEEQGERMEKEREGGESDKWLKYYASSHQILLVGEGDFSFSFSLANSFASASNIVSTSLDHYDVVIKKYSKAKSNLEGLKKLGAIILHGVDATKMKLHTDLKMRKFDRIIFNFPHAGFRGKEDDMHQMRLHRYLVIGFFNSASRMLRPYGEIHVNHKTTKPYCCWKIEELASQCSLTWLDRVKFERTDYPGYNNKRGDGPRCDEPFRLGECHTFKFGIMGVRQYKKQEAMGCTHKQSHFDLPGTQQVDTAIGNGSEQPQICYNSRQKMPETQYWNPRNFIRIDTLQASHAMDMQGMPTRQDANPRISIRSDQLSVYPGKKVLEMQQGNPEVFSRSDHALHNSYPNPDNNISSVTNPRTSSRNYQSPAYHPATVDKTLETQHGDTVIFNRNDHRLSAGYIPMTYSITVPDSSGSSGNPQTIKISSECLRIFDGYLSHNEEMFGRTDYDFGGVAQVLLTNGYDMYMKEQPGRNVHEYIQYLQQLRQLSILRSEQLTRLLHVQIEN